MVTKIKNSNDLEKVMDSIMQNALIQCSIRVRDIINEFIEYWYSDYDPTIYKRTFQFLNSCVSSEVNKHGNKYSVVIWIDVNSMNHNLPSYIHEQDIVNAAEIGFHGATTGHMEKGNEGVGFWQESKESIEKNKVVTKAFTDFLSSKGLSFKVR